MMTKYATLEGAQILDIKGSATRSHVASLDKLGDFENYRTGDGYMYVRIKAQSSRVNKNHDGWPSIELAGGKDIFEKHARESSTGFTLEASEGSDQTGFATFMGKPNFVDHHNSDPKRHRGVVVDSKLLVKSPESKEAKLDPYYSSDSVDPEHMPPTDIELLLEIDAEKFPKYAKAVKEGEIDGWSMGCDVEHSKCSHCGHIATSPDEYCSHIQAKGAHHDYKTADGKRVSRRSYENCYGINYFEISGVFEPADESAITQEITSSFTKGSPDPGDDSYFGGKPGASKEAYDAMIKQYGKEKGEEVYYATRNKKKGKDSSIHTAENPLPQSFQTQAPEEVDTLRNEQKCPVCGEDMEGEKCDVCGYVEPPKGFDNPDLNKAQGLQEEMKDADSVQIPNEEGQMPPPDQQMGAQPGASQARQPGSFLNPGARNSPPTASVTSDMHWTVQVEPRIAARINRNERPIKTTLQPATNEPTKEVVTSDQPKPVTSTMLTAQKLIQTAQRNHTGETMSTRTADGPTPPEASPDARVDVTGTGGVIEPSNEAASSPDGSTDVTGIGGVGVADVEAESTTELSTAAEGSDDAGFNKDKTTEDSGPTKTFGDSDGTEKGVSDSVTTESLEGNQNTSARQSYDDAPFVDEEINHGKANQGVEPIDAVGKADKRVNLLEHTTSPSNNSGPTKTWSGTDGNGVQKQQDPTTKDVVWNNTDNAWNSHIISALKIADTEIALDLISEDEKYNRIAELQKEAPEVLASREDTLSRVKTAGLAKLAQAHTSGVTKIPAMFGRRTAAPNTGRYVGGEFKSSFDRTAGNDEPEIQDESILDSGLFSR